MLLTSYEEALINNKQSQSLVDLRNVILVFQYSIDLTKSIIYIQIQKDLKIHVYLCPGGNTKN